LERRSVVMLGLGFASGLPFWLIFDTLSAWLRTVGLSLNVIAFFSLATLAYAFKFLWAPMVDRSSIPGLTRWLGHRRSWMLGAQALIIAGLVLIAVTDPIAHLSVTAALAVLTGFSGATQDIVMDAWRIEVAEEREQGVMLAAYQWGHRIAYITAGAAPLFLADAFNWSVSYFAMAAFMGIGVAAVLMAPRERAHNIRPIPRVAGVTNPWLERLEWSVRLITLVIGALIMGSGLSAQVALIASCLPTEIAEPLRAAWAERPAGIFYQFGAVVVGLALIVACAWPLPGKPTQPGYFLSHVFGEPIGDFFSRFGHTAGLILGLICLYRLSEFVLNIMNPFYLDIGFSLTQIAEVRKVYGVILSLVGIFAGGYAVAKWGVMRSLLIGAIIAPLSNLMFSWLATQGPDVSALIITLGVNNICQSFAGTCLLAYMSSLTSIGFTATQYALFSSLYALPDKLIATQSGRIVDAAAQSAASGGLMTPLQALFSSLNNGTLVAGASRTGMTAEALGAGYFAFFIYTCVIGFAALPLVIIVARRQSSAAA
jgi:MFS transporter, PAT family, beta-lactamase induction signal transducer AmpG